MEAEELELLLLHKEPRKVAQARTINDSGRYYRAPEAYIGRRVSTRPQGDLLRIQVGRTTVAEYTLDHEPRA